MADIKNNFAKIRSDYSPTTSLMISISEDGDIGIKIVGDGEMRIAESGGHFHGEDYCKLMDAFRNVVEVINEVTKG